MKTYEYGAALRPAGSRASVTKTCRQAAMAKRPCLISISCQRRYLSGILFMSWSGSKTPSGLVVPMSPAAAGLFSGVLRTTLKVSVSIIAHENAARAFKISPAGHPDSLLRGPFRKSFSAVSRRFFAIFLENTEFHRCLRCKIPSSIDALDGIKNRLTKTADPV